MKYWVIVLFVFVLSACSTGRAAELVSDAQFAVLPDLGAAPELTNDIWLNTEHPLHIADLEGQVVLLEMWTSG